MSISFKNRVFGCVIIKSINSNYNADFTHQPRTLPDGTVYATDKVLKYSIRNYFKKVYSDEKVFFFKFLNAEMQPLTLLQNYEVIFNKKLPKVDKKDKGAAARKEVLVDLLNCIDVRLFGATFAPKATKEKKSTDDDSEDDGKKEEGKNLNLSIHGAVQITHGLNRFPENAIYSEQISSPFRNPGDDSANSTQTTLGTQFKLREGHYVHHFSVNPQNLDDLVGISGGEALNEDDILKLKNGLAHGVTFYDSSAKAGTENELLLWVQLKPESKLVLPSFVELISIADDKKRTIDLSKVTDVLSRPNISSAIEKIEIWYDNTAATVEGAPANAVYYEIHG
ncbi:type I CRISPR-associated protein Cas7 [Runella sp.]|uniref:type I CRISPR-associated protein Cas7 n=1 Tax=Runella sp. TaxID=1960881 RepID=UPI0030181647